MENWNCRVVIIDCSLSDDTSPAAADLQNRHDGVCVLKMQHRDNLDKMYDRGFEEAVKNFQADVVIEFSGDLLYPPSVIPVLLEKIGEGADMVTGSCRVQGGSYSEETGMGEKLRRTLQSLFVRITLFFPTKKWFRITDPTAELMAIRIADSLKTEAGLPESLGGTDHRLALLYRAARSGAAFVETPVQCRSYLCPGLDRVHKNFLQTLQAAFRLRWGDPETKRFVKFGVVGFVGYIINASALELFRYMTVSAAIVRFFSGFPALNRFGLLTSQSAWSAGLAAELSIISNYLFNNFWTFSTHKISSPIRFISKLLQFNFTSFGGIIIQFFVIGAATILLGDTPLIRGLALVFAIVFLIIPYNWTVYNRLIWRVKRFRKRRKKRDG
jgi:dolichol-phosphate mannosyltransferase